MPELPEVQTTVNGLNATIVNLKITDVWSDYHLRTTSKRKDNIKHKKYFEYFKKEVTDEKVKNVERRGKNVLISLTHGKTVLVHMKMTGHFLYGKYFFENKKWKSDEKFLSDSFNKFIHLLFTLSNGKHLAFSDMRKFAKVIVIKDDKKESVSDLTELGPEPIPSLSFNLFKKQLHKKPNGKIKTVLMDQHIVAGIGNIYSDEILWTAGIHPERKVLTLTDREVREILKAVKKILLASIALGGDSMSDYRNIYGEKGEFQNVHKVYRKTGQKCSRKNCSGIIVRKVINGRSGHFCSIHQK